MENLVVTGRVAVTVAVAPLFAVGLYRTVARVLEKATVLVSDDGLAWIWRTACSLPVGSGLLIAVQIRCCCACREERSAAETHAELAGEAKKARGLLDAALPLLQKPGCCCSSGCCCCSLQQPGLLLRRLCCCGGSAASTI